MPTSMAISDQQDLGHQADQLLVEHVACPAQKRPTLHFQPGRRQGQVNPGAPCCGPCGQLWVRGHGLHERFGSREGRVQQLLPCGVSASVEPPFHGSVSFYCAACVMRTMVCEVAPSPVPQTDTALQRSIRISPVLYGWNFRCS